MNAALENVSVVDLTRRFWSSLAAALLGDFGASVVKVEGADDEAGCLLDESGGGEDAAWNYRYDLANRNKLSLSLDFNSGEGRAVLRRLVEKSDVLISDRDPAELEGLGLDRDWMKAANPSLIYTRATGFGPEGPDSGLPAIDELAAARAGMMPILGQPGQPPVYPGHGQMYATVMLAFATVTALFHRDKSGEGQEVNASLLGGNMYGASLDLQAFLAIGGERFLHPVSRLDAGNPMSGVLYPASDGLWITLTMPDTDRWWPALAEIVGLDAGDPRFDSHDKRCGEGRLELLQLLDEAFRKHPSSYWREVFAERQMSADVIEDYNYPANDDSARDNRYLLDLVDPSLGPLSMLGFPIFMTGTPARLSRTAPRKGQHSAQVLRDIAGYGETEIAAMEQAGVLR